MLTTAGVTRSSIGASEGAPGVHDRRQSGSGGGGGDNRDTAPAPARKRHGEGLRQRGRGMRSPCGDSTSHSTANRRQWFPPGWTPRPPATGAHGVDFDGAEAYVGVPARNHKMLCSTRRAEPNLGSHGGA